MADSVLPRLEVLGRSTVRGPGGVTVVVARPQVAAVLAMLWDERRAVRREELAELLWGTGTFPITGRALSAG